MLSPLVHVTSATWQFLGGLSLHLNHLIASHMVNYKLAIWETSFWTFLLKFGHKGP